MFDIAAGTSRSQPYWQRRALRQGLRLENESRALQNELAQKDIDTYDDQLAMEQDEIDIKRGNLEQRIGENMRNLSKDQRESLENASVAGLQALESGDDPTVAFTESLRSSGFNPPEGVAFDEDSAKAVIADAETYRAVERENAKLTQDEKLIERLPISDTEKADLKQKIAEKRGTIVGRTPEDIDPRTPSQVGADFQEKINEFESSTNLQEMIGSAMPEISALPNTVGATGSIALGGAGLLSTLGQEAMAEKFAEFVAGADAETIASMQTRLQAIRGRIIPLVTGEQGKRISETEREVANRAVGLIDSIQGPADLTKSYPRVVGALKQLYEESWASKYRLASQNESIPYPYDLSKKADMVELIEQFGIAGIDEQGIRRAITRLRAIQGIE